MTEKFAVTFYKQWRSMLLLPTLLLPLVLLALRASKLVGFGNVGFLLYVAMLVGGLWAIPRLVRRWALIPTEVTISDTALAIEYFTTGEILEIPFAEIQAYVLNDWRLLIHLQDGRKIGFRVSRKFYNPGNFAEMSRRLEHALRVARGGEVMRLE